MRHALRIALPGITLLALHPLPLPSQSAYIIDETTSHVVFRGRALAQPIVGRSERLQGGVIMRGRDLRTVRGDIRFPVVSLDTDPRMKQDEISKVFGGETSPDVIFRVDSIHADKTSDVWHLHGHLTMNGIVRPVLFEGAAKTVGARLLAEGVTRVDVRDWHIDPPRKLGGLVRMSPEITLSFRAEFRPRAPATSPLVARRGGSL